MHTGIVLVCEAHSAEEAVEEIQSFNEYNAQWSDWNEHGGRWSDKVPNSVLKYTDNPELFMATVNEFVGYIEETKQNYLKKIGDISLKELVTNEEYSWSNFKGDVSKMTQQERDELLDKSLTVFRANKLMALVDGKFGSDTNFFDTVEHETTTDSLEKRIKENPDQQFLVVWDYHF